MVQPFREQNSHFQPFPFSGSIWIKDYKNIYLFIWFLHVNVHVTIFFFPEDCVAFVCLEKIHEKLVKLWEMKNLLWDRQTKLCAKIMLTSDWYWKAKKCSKTLYKELERQNIQDQTISKLYADDNISKYP